jgi:hypothetical protein
MATPVVSKTKKITNQRRREELAKSVDWSGFITNLSSDLKTTLGRTVIRSRIDSYGNPGISRTSRINCVIEQIERLEYKPVPLQNLISLILNSETYTFRESSNTREKKVEMIKWDIATLCFDGKAAYIPKLNESLLDI